MDFSDIPGAFVKLFELITASSSSAIFSFVGIVLLFLAGGLAYIAITSKPEELSPLVKTALFISLLGGMLFSAAGPSLALLDVAKNSIKKMKVEEAFKNLENNTEVHYVVRLISFDPNEEPALAIDRLTNLGPPISCFPLSQVTTNSSGIQSRKHSRRWAKATGPESGFLLLYFRSVLPCIQRVRGDFYK